jgi:tripartite-type tricarboxylate transporter receptor subunit TctC
MGRSWWLMLAVSLGCSPHALGQAFPGKPLRFIVSFPAGGGSDVMARILAPRLSENLGQQVIVDNRAGAGGLIGTEAAVRAAPDGYTMVLSSPGEVAISRAVYSKLAFDTARDLLPIAKIAFTPLVLATHPSLPATNVRELVALARQRPGELNYGSVGNATIPHLAAELFRSLAAVQIVHVAYKGAAPALTDLISGQIQLMFPTLPAASPHIGSGRIRGLAVTTALHAAVAFALQQADVVAGLTKQGAEPVNESQQQFARFVDAEIEKWARLVKASGVKADE